MNLQQRIDLLIRLREYILSDHERWKEAKLHAERANSWFTSEFIDHSVNTIAHQFLDPEKLKQFVLQYSIREKQPEPKTVGLVMAGNIPLVGFHDFLCIFIGGHHAIIKPSSKDEVLIKHLVELLVEWHIDSGKLTSNSALLKGCDAYIATGSNNSSRYFDYYFGKYPSIIRRNRSSVAMLTGDESTSDLEKLADDVHLYFGLGCRNVTKIYVPEKYDFLPLLNVFRRYGYFADHQKYRNNYDYQLAIHLLNNKYYMTNGSILLSENEPIFSPISQLNYQYYSTAEPIGKNLLKNNDVQCIIGEGFLPFGKAQSPSLTDYADAVDTMNFILGLEKPLRTT